MLINISKTISLAALLLAGVAQSSQAQSNETLALNINLTAVSQGNLTTNRDGTVTHLQVARITSKSIIQVLGTVLNTTFSHKARLQVLAPTSALDNWTIQIQDGTNAAVDVTGFFGHQPGSPSVIASGCVANRSRTVILAWTSSSLQDQSDFQP